MRIISDETLLESYFKAIDLNLDSDFLDLLFDEISRRKLNNELEKRKAN